MSTPTGPDGSDELGDTLGGEDHLYGMVEARLALGPAMACLTERERTILAMRFYGNLTQAQIADRIGVSQMHVSRLIAGALLKLRRKLGPDAA